MTIDEVIARLRAIMPKGWLPETAQNFNAIVSGFALVASNSHAMLLFAKEQSRLGTASGGFLDLYAYDFLGLRYQRRGRSDEKYRSLIKREILRERVTRRGIVEAVADLTGTDVSAWEPFNPSDCGGFDTGYLAFDDAGRWGSLDLPHQIFIDAVQPIGAGIPNASGLDESHGGFDEPILQHGDLRRVVGLITSQDIYDTINNTRAAGVICWVAITAKPAVYDNIDNDFVLDQSLLA